MLDILIVSLAVAGILSAIDEFIPSIRKYRALIALGAALGSYLGIDTDWVRLPLYALATAFLALLITLVVDTLSEAEFRRLPRRPKQR